MKTSKLLLCFLLTITFILSQYTIIVLCQDLEEVLSMLEEVAAANTNTGDNVTNVDEAEGSLTAIEDIDEVTLFVTEPNITIDRSCYVETNAWFQGSTYNDPSEAIFSNFDMCCQMCRDDDDCVAWTWEATRGACALKNKETDSIISTLYVSGRISNGTNIFTTNTLYSLTLDDGQEEAAECYIENKTKYESKNILEESTKSSANKCCTDCSENIECFSWQYNTDTEICTLNSDVPNQTSDDEFSGGTIV